MAVEFVDFAKEAADRQTAVTQAEKGKFELEQTKKATAEKESESKGIYDILKGYDSGGTQQAKAPAPTDAGPGGYDPATQTTGEDRQQAASFKDQMAMNQAQGKQMGQEAQMLQKLMLNSAKNNDPEAALKFRTQLDGLEQKYRDNQKSQMALQTDQAEFQGRVAQGYLANPTDEEWYNVVRESMKAGLPGAEQLLTVPKDKREAVAKAAIAQSMSTKDTATAQLNAAKLKEKSQEFYDGLEVKRMIADNTMRNQALMRELAQERIDISKDTHNKARNDAMLAKITPRLTQAKEDYNEADREYRESAARLRDIEDGNIIIRDKDKKAEEIAQLKDNMRTSAEARDSAKKNRATLTKQYEDLSIAAYPDLKTKDETPTEDPHPKDAGGTHADYNEYVTRWNAAKSPEEKAKVDKFALDNGIIKPRTQTKTATPKSTKKVSYSDYEIQNMGIAQAKKVFDSAGSDEQNRLAHMRDDLYDYWLEKGKAK